MKTCALTTRRPARPGIAAQRSPLAGYLAGAAGLSALLAAPQVEAAVTSVTFGFGSELSFPADNNGNFTVGAFGVIRANSNATYTSIGAHPASNLGGVYNTGLLFGDSGIPTFFANGTVIGAGGNGAIGYGYFRAYGSGSVIDLTSDQLNKNIGFKTSTDNWGWANVSWNETAQALTINSAYVESVVGNSITVGAVPEPSRALLALAGLGGVALRRRRKLAA